MPAAVLARLIAFCIFHHLTHAGTVIACQRRLVAPGARSPVMEQVRMHCTPNRSGGLLTLHVQSYSNDEYRTSRTYDDRSTLGLDAKEEATGLHERRFQMWAASSAFAMLCMLMYIKCM